MAGNVTDEQVVASSVDVIFIVMSLDDDFGVRRMERYLLMAREGGAAPVVLLTKPDLSADLPADVADVVAAAGDVPVHVLSPKLNQGLDQMAPYVTAGRTSAARVLWRRQEHDHQPSGRRRCAEDPRGSRVRLQGPSHDNAS